MKFSIEMLTGTVGIALVDMGTGRGETLLYQLPALLCSAIQRKQIPFSVVIIPLVALLRDITEIYRNAAASRLHG